MPSERDVWIAQHLRRLAIDERRLRRLESGLLVSQFGEAASAYESDGNAGVAILRPEFTRQQRGVLVAHYPIVAQRNAQPVWDRLGEPQVTFLDLVLGFIEEFALAKARRISGTTFKIIRDLIFRGQEEGSGAAVIAKSIREAAPAISRARSFVIARTETHGAAAFASRSAAQLTGLNLVKEWLAVSGDDRTRETHRAGTGVDGQERPFDVHYDVPGSDTVPPARMMRPGDPSAPPGQVIQCRCTELYRPAA